VRWCYGILFHVERLTMIITKIMAATIMGLLVVVGLEWIAIQGYKVDAARTGSALAALSTELSQKEANNMALMAEISAQNTAFSTMQRVADEKRKAAIVARDAALAALNKAKGDYARLRKDWPQECVAAVARVRQELGL
jgi:uncharacterized iron-regulated membrane protein